MAFEGQKEKELSTFLAAWGALELPRIEKSVRHHSNCFLYRGLFMSITNSFDMKQILSSLS